MLRSDTPAAEEWRAKRIKVLETQVKKLQDFEERCSLQGEKLLRRRSKEKIFDVTGVDPLLIHRMLQSKDLMDETINLLRR